MKTFFIIDEAQNLTPHEVKTIITRADEGTKGVLTGDIFHIDHPDLDTESNGLSYLIEKMRGQGLYAHVNLEKGERCRRQCATHRAPSELARAERSCRRAEVYRTPEDARTSVRFQGDHHRAEILGASGERLVSRSGCLSGFPQRRE